jgi:hypothetical protein
MNDDDTTTGEYFPDEENTCEGCGGVLTQNSFTEEYWGAQVLQTEWVCKNCD